MGIDGIQDTGYGSRETQHAARSTITIHIERVVLEGVDMPTHDAGQLRTVIEQELARLLSQRQTDDALWTSGAVHHRQGDAITWPATEGVTRLGTQIAQAVYGGMIA